MHYLLVGNAPHDDLQALAIKSDIIIQMNSCIHAETLSPFPSQYVFGTNTGRPLVKWTTQIREHRNRGWLQNPVVILARNPNFYRLKRYLQLAKLETDSQSFTPSNDWKELGRDWRIELMSYSASSSLEKKMRLLGMESNSMPSTGMVAYDWICNRLTEDDSLTLAGFTFEGWQRHPWHIEKDIIKPSAVGVKKYWFEEFLGKQPKNADSSHHQDEEAK